MRIAIATNGRFHVLDLARELAALGHDVAFYSIVPRQRALRFGLPVGTHRALLPWLLPLVVLQRYAGKRLRRALNPLMVSLVDRLIAWRLEPCDVFIGMSGICVLSARAARERYGAKVLIERGSRHILSQQSILGALEKKGLKAGTVPEYAIRRELQSYAIADRIVVGSHHVVESFVNEGVPEERLFRNPYGVDFGMFQPTTAPADLKPTVLFVGGWMYRKGVDVLIAALKELEGINLLHVGDVDAPLTTTEYFEHHDSVPQWQLSSFYARAHIFVLASREEGLSLVQAQALASGLPVVCTDRTGGGDLKVMLEDPSWITVVPHDDANALAQAIQQMLPPLHGTKWPAGPARFCTRAAVLGGLWQAVRE